MLDKHVESTTPIASFSSTSLAFKMNWEKGLFLRVKQDCKEVWPKILEKFQRICRPQEIYLYSLKHCQKSIDKSVIYLPLFQIMKFVTLLVTVQATFNAHEYIHATIKTSRFCFLCTIFTCWLFKVERSLLLKNLHFLTYVNLNYIRWLISTKVYKMWKK